TKTGMQALRVFDRNEKFRNPSPFILHPSAFILVLSSQSVPKIRKNSVDAVEYHVNKIKKMCSLLKAYTRSISSTFPLYNNQYEKRTSSRHPVRGRETKHNAPFDDEYVSVDFLTWKADIESGDSAEGRASAGPDALSLFLCTSR
ncbi:MAG: hypothetical protein WCH39_27430, partial [Schlesneria sp.]